jgi:molybdate transport system regulatory protein
MGLAWVQQLLKEAVELRRRKRVTGSIYPVKYVACPCDNAAMPTASRAGTVPNALAPADAAPLCPLVRPRIRVLRGEEVALGPGKVALLAAVAERGSLVEAARALGMSYMRAWRLVQTMNACFQAPLIETRRGGRVHGGAVLTDCGAAVLALYQRMERDSLEAIAPAWEQLRGLLV